MVFALSLLSYYLPRPAKTRVYTQVSYFWLLIRGVIRYTCPATREREREREREKERERGWPGAPIIHATRAFITRARSEIGRNVKAFSMNMDGRYRNVSITKFYSTLCAVIRSLPSARFSFFPFPFAPRLFTPSNDAEKCRVTKCASYVKKTRARVLSFFLPLFCPLSLRVSLRIFVFFLAVRARIRTRRTIEQSFVNAHAKGKRKKVKK